jgi:hypothetical protein
MSCWSPFRTLKLSSTLFAKFFLALGLLASAQLLGGLSVGANPPDEKGPALDDRPPLPGVTDPTLAERLPIPNPDRAIFAGRWDAKKNPIPNTGIVDFEEIASEKKNSDEYMAWHEIVQHAKQFSTNQLEEYARKDLTRDDLIGLGPPPRIYRLSLIRFEGKLIKVRRLTATKSLRDAGTMEVYEAQLVAFDDPPNEYVSFVFTELPLALKSLAEKPVEEWMDVNADAVVAGYFFKVKQDPLQTEKLPVLIGKSLTMLPVVKEQPSKLKDEKNPIAIDKNLKVFRSIKDDARIVHGSENWEEAVAWNRVLLHARRFTPEELESNARTDLRFADLFEDIRKDFKLQPVKFEGRLLMVRKMESSQKLKSAGVEAAYEGWLAPKDEPRGNPVCIVFTDPLPDGVETGRVNKWVSFAGYSFKLMRYESGERDKDDHNVTKKAPLLLGRAIIPQLDPDRPSSISWSAFVQVALIVIFGLIGIAGVLTWWFRRGDRRAKEEIVAQRAKNPFSS